MDTRIDVSIPRATTPGHDEEVDPAPSTTQHRSSKTVRTEDVYALSGQNRGAFIAHLDRAVGHRQNRTGVNTGQSEVSSQFREQLTALAQDRGAFEAFLKTTFGEAIDSAAAQRLLGRVRNGDFSWLPEVRFVGRAVLGSAKGAYDQADGLIYIRSDLSPKQAAATFVEEMGHYLDTLLNGSDARGDEGELFRRLLSGERLTPEQIASIRRENDHGTLTVNGKTVFVEFRGGRGRRGRNSVSLADGGPIYGREREYGEGGKRVDGYYGKDILDASNAGPYINGRVVGLKDGFADFRLERVAGTNDDYYLIPGRTPYDGVAAATGIDWKTLDRAWLDLEAQGNSEAAAQLRQGILPDLEVFSGEMRAMLTPHYDRIAREAKAPAPQTPLVQPPAPETAAPPTPPAASFHGSGNFPFLQLPATPYMAFSGGRPVEDAGPILGEEVRRNDGRTMVRLSGVNADVLDASNAGPVINGRVVGPDDGFGGFHLERITGTNNDYNLVAGTTPYDALARATGIDWQTLDQVWLELDGREGMGRWAALVREGTLPPFGVLSGPLQERLRPHYAQLVQRASMRHDRSLAEVEAALGQLYSSDPVLAGEILLGRAELDLHLEQTVVEAHHAAQIRVYEPTFDTPEGVGRAAHVYIAAEHLPEAERGALRDQLDAVVADAGNRSVFQAALATAWQADLGTHVRQLSLAYADAWEREGDSSAVNELLRMTASVSVRELRSEADRLIQESGTRTAYDTIETRLQDDALAALPEPLEQAIRVAIVGELGRIHALDVLATEAVASLEGDAAADAKLLTEYQDNLLPYLSASIQRRGVEQTLLDMAAALHQVDGAKREALGTALQDALEALPEDIAFKQAERGVGTLEHVRALVSAQSQVRAQYGDEAAVTQIVEEFVFREQEAVQGNTEGIDLRVAPLVDYGQIEQQADIPPDQLWRYVSDEGLRQANLSPELQSLDPETFDIILDPNADIDFADAQFRQQVSDALSTGERESIDDIAVAEADAISAELVGKSVEAQRELLASRLFARNATPGTGDFASGLIRNYVAAYAGSNDSAIDYVLASTDPATQRARIQQVILTESAIIRLRPQAIRAGQIAGLKAFEEAGVRDSARVTRPPGTAIPFVESAVTRTVDYGIKRGVLDSEVMLDTRWAARGVVGWTETDTADAPARQIDPETWTAAFTLRIGEDELGKFSQLQMTTSLSYVNRAKTLGEQLVRAEQALQALITTHKVGAPPSTLGEIGADLISVHPNFDDVRSRHIDELAPYIGLPMSPTDDHFELDTGDWQYRIRNDETGAIVGMRVRERDDGPSTDMIVSGVLTILSYVPYVQVVAIPLNYAYQGVRAVETDDLLRGVTAAVGATNWGASVVANSATATASTVSTAETIVNVTNTTMTAIQTGNALYNAIQSEDPLAIASAAISAAGASTDGILSVNLNRTSASIDIARAVKDDQLGLGLYGLSNFVGTMSQRESTLDPKANTYSLDTTTDAIRFAGNLVGENYIGAINSLGTLATRDNTIDIDLRTDPDQFPTLGDYTLPSLDPLETDNAVTAGDGVESGGSDPSWEEEITRPDASGEDVINGGNGVRPASGSSWTPEVTRLDYSGVTPGDTRRFEIEPTQNLSVSAHAIIDRFTNLGGLNLQEEALGNHLALTTAAGDHATVEAVLHELSSSNQDDVVRALVDNLSTTQLEDLATTDTGLDLIKTLRRPVSTGVVTEADEVGVDRLEAAFYSNTDHLDFVIDMAELAQDVYQPSGAPKGWTRMNADLPAAVLENLTWKNETTGFNAALYQSDAGQVVLVFEGTNSDPLSADGKVDWWNNLRNGAGVSSEQYEAAIVLAESVRQYYGDEVVITGHSLGGGLTAAASTVTGLDGYTFNAAGVHSNTLAPFDVSRDQALGLVEAYNVSGDVVTSLQHPLVTGLLNPVRPLPVELFPDAAGHRFSLPALAADGSSPSIFEASPVDRHGMDFVIRGLEAQRIP